MFVSPIKAICSIVSLKKDNNKSVSKDNLRCCNSVKTPAFKSTSEGAPLKVLKNITDPYFGEKMINSETYLAAESQLNHFSFAEPTVKFLRNFRSNLQVVEREVYNTFIACAGNFKDWAFDDILKTMYSQALEYLKIEELNALKKINTLSMDLHPLTSQEIQGKIEKCRQIILEDDPNNRFKRKTLLDSLNKIEPRDREEPYLNKLKLQAEFLPSSNTSVNAFIVKYANRKHEEIAKRLICASRQCIDHVLADSKGGEDSLDNFVPTSMAANEAKKNLDLPEFTYIYPQALFYPQYFINDIISVIHNGGLQGHQTYPYKIARTFYNESEGKIQLDLSRYQLAEVDAERLEQKHKFKHKNK